MVEKVWFQKDFSGDAKILFIALAGNLIVPGKWEWANVWSGMYKDLKFKKMWLCDNNKSWWQTRFPGIDGYGPRPLSVFLKKQIEEANVDKVVLMGLSMGGFGSLILGTLLNASEVIAISPQTFITPGRVRKAHLKEKFKGLDIDPQYKDFKLLLENNPQVKTDFHIYYGYGHPGDKRMALRVEHFPGVHLHGVNSDRHTVARVLVKNNLLGWHMKLLCESVRG
jgi:pimeloyl-ACP methyl ester carboxylesterase